VHETRLAISMRRMVENHEIHIDACPRQIAVELGGHMKERTRGSLWASKQRRRVASAEIITGWPTSSSGKDPDALSAATIFCAAAAAFLAPPRRRGVGCR